jgi:integrase
MLWSHKDDDYARIALVYIYTGLRYSELHDLTPDRCHENYIEIINAKTAAGNRIVPLSDKVQQLLPIIKVPPRTTFERKFRYFLPDHYIHETRHTFITMLTEAGVDDRVIKAIVGHKSNNITEVYTHISLDVMLEAVNRL